MTKPNIGYCKTTGTAGNSKMTLAHSKWSYCALPGHPVAVGDYCILIVNEANMTISDDQGRDLKISGTYLVTYSVKISLNGTWIVNQLGSSIKNLRCQP